MPSNRSPDLRSKQRPALFGARAFPSRLAESVVRRDSGLLRAVAIAHSCGAVADFNRLPVHSTANEKVSYK
jgi:hypothetical protein